VKGEEKRGLRRSDELAEPCVSASVSNGLALCFDIILATSNSLSFLLPAISLTSYSSPRIVPLPTTVPVTLRAVLSLSQTLPSYLPRPTCYRPRRVTLALIVAMSYLLSSLPPVSSLTSYSSLCILQLPGVSVTLRAALTMSQSLPSYSPRPTHYHPHRLLLALIVATSYSLSSSLCLTRSYSRHVLLAIILATGVLIDIVLVTVYSTTSWCLCDSESCANHVTKLAIILATSYTLSSSLPVSSSPSFS